MTVAPDHICQNHMHCSGKCRLPGQQRTHAANVPRVTVPATPEHRAPSTVVGVLTSRSQRLQGCGGSCGIKSRVGHFNHSKNHVTRKRRVLTGTRGEHRTGKLALHCICHLPKPKTKPDPAHPHRGPTTECPHPTCNTPAVSVGDKPPAPRSGKKSRLYHSA
jgi:hypothetical protein